MPITSDVKDTALTEKHLALGAKIAPFAGYRMPIQYSGILAEHKATRTSAGLFDLSHMGEFEVMGPGLLGFLERMTTNDVGSLQPFQAHYTLMLNENGGIIDDLLIYHLPGRAFLVVNAANKERDLAWLNEHRPDSVEIVDRSDEISLIAIQGPKATDVLARMVDFDLSELKYYHSAQGTVGGMGVIFSRTGYTGEDGFELYVPNALAESCWDAAMEAGAELDILPVGLGARDTLRMEMKFALHGIDIDETTNPIEAGLGWTVKPNKSVAFIGRDAVVAIRESGTARKLVGFTMDEKAIPRTGCDILVGGETAGKVTSGTHSPSLDQGIGMGYVPTDHAKPGTTIEIMVRKQPVPATIIKPPFVKNTSHK